MRGSNLKRLKGCRGYQEDELFSYSYPITSDEVRDLSETELLLCLLGNVPTHTLSLSLSKMLFYLFIIFSLMVSPLSMGLMPVG